MTSGDQHPSLRRLADLFADVIEAKPDQRAAALALLTPTDRSAIAALLNSAQRAEEVLEKPRWDVASLDGATGEFAAISLPPGTMAGRFTVISEIGRGGMGVVYRGRQAEPDRDVALKVLAMPFPSQDAVRRFRREAAALARLRHDGVATIYESGAIEGSSGAIPYLAMELVEGQPITRHARAAKLDFNGSMALVAQVCDAVAHAHQRGVIHRDLKPGNILVDNRGRARVLDFGIAKLLELEGSDAGARPGGGGTIESGRIPGTPAYMSPEQAAGAAADIDARTDVYSLGVILYELVTGRLPIDPAGRSMPAMLAAISMTGPAKMFEHPTARQRDIEAVTRKALAKSPAERYQSVPQLAADLQALADGRTPSVRPARLSDSIRDLYRRHRVPTWIASAAMVLVIAGATVATFQWSRAQTSQKQSDAAFHRLMEEASVLVRDVERTVRDLPGSAAARRQILERAVAMYEVAAAMKPNDLELLDQMATAYVLLASAAGLPGNANTGDRDLADDFMARAVAIRRRLVSLQPGDPRPTFSLALSLENQAISLNDPKRQMELTRESLGLMRRAESQAPHFEGIDPRQWRTLLVRATYVTANFEDDESAARALGDEAIELARKNGGLPGASTSERAELAMALEYGSERILESEPAKAQMQCAEAVEIYQSLLEDAYWKSSAIPHRGTCQVTGGAAMILQGLPRGIEAVAEGLNTLESHCANDPKDTFRSRQLAGSLSQAALAAAKALDLYPESPERARWKELAGGAARQALEMFQALEAIGQTVGEQGEERKQLKAVVETTGSNGNSTDK